METFSQLNATMLWISKKTLTLVVKFKSLLYRCDGAEHWQSIHSTLDVRCSSEFVSKHARHTRDLITRRNDERNHACAIPVSNQNALKLFLVDFLCSRRLHSPSRSLQTFNKFLDLPHLNISISTRLALRRHLENLSSTEQPVEITTNKVK